MKATLDDILTEQRKTNKLLLAILNQEKDMAVKDVKEFQDLIAQVAATRGVEASAVTAINSIADRLDAAVAAVAGGTVTIADLQAAVSEQTGLLRDSASPLAEAITRDPDPAAQPASPAP